MSAGGLYAGSVTGTALYAAGLVGLVLVVLAGVTFAAWRDRDRHDPVDPVVPAGILPDLVRAWLVDNVRVRHNVLGLGTVVDATPTHAPGGTGLYVLVRFDTVADPRWIRPRDLDPITALDEERLRAIAERRASRAVFLTPAVDNVDRVRQVWPAQCGDRGACYWHRDACGTANTLSFGDVSYCCGGCPARGGAR